MMKCADFSSHVSKGFQNLALFSLFEEAASKEDFPAELCHEFWIFFT